MSLSPRTKTQTQRTGTAKSVAAKSARATVSTRSEITRETIAVRAYSLWEQAGRPSGRDLEFWSLAEQQLKQK